MRGIPQLYYGTEILMSGKTKTSDGFVRKDFPGGWPHDSLNKFVAKGRTDKENEAFDFVKSLANYRRNKPVLQDGKLMQFVPNDDVYVYFRYDDVHCVMVVLNSSKDNKKLDISKYAERMNGYKSGMDIVSGTAIKDLTAMSIAPKSSMIIELHR
jgi:glycosidase